MATWAWQVRGSKEKESAALSLLFGTPIKIKQGLLWNACCAIHAVVTRNGSGTGCGKESEASLNDPPREHIHCRPIRLGCLDPQICKSVAEAVQQSADDWMVRVKIATYVCDSLGQRIVRFDRGSVIDQQALNVSRDAR